MELTDSTAHVLMAPESRCWGRQRARCWGGDRRCDRHSVPVWSVAQLLAVPIDFPLAAFLVNVSGATFSAIVIEGVRLLEAGPSCPEIAMSVGKLLRITIVGENDRWRQKPLYHESVEAAHPGGRLRRLHDGAGGARHP